MQTNEGFSDPDLTSWRKKIILPVSLPSLTSLSHPASLLSPPFIQPHFSVTLHPVYRITEPIAITSYRIQFNIVGVLLFVLYPLSCQHSKFRRVHELSCCSMNPMNFAMSMLPLGRQAGRQRKHKPDVLPAIPPDIGVKTIIKNNIPTERKRIRRKSKMGHFPLQKKNILQYIGKYHVIY